MKPFTGSGASISLGGFHGDRLFSGVLDEVMLSPRSLTDEDVSWLIDGGDATMPMPPQVVALPLGLSPTTEGHRLTILFSNFSHQEVSLDLAKLKWRLAGDEEIPYRLTGIWALNEIPQRLESPQVTLGPAHYGTGWFELGRSSPLLWTGALWGLLTGPAEGSPPNAILVEVDLRGTSFSGYFRTDGDSLAREAISSDGMPVRIAIHESPLTRLPNNMPVGVFLHPQSLSASDINDPTQNAQALVDEDPGTFWHIEIPPKTSRHWVAMDFGRPVQPTGLSVLPRRGFPDQLWSGENAILQGSQNGQFWQDITRLLLDKESLPSGSSQVLSFVIPAGTAYRHYRLFINDPGFYALGEIWFLAESKTVSIHTLAQRGIVEITPPSPGNLGEVRFKEKDATITSLVEVPPDYRLVLEAGTTLRFGDSGGILAYGPISARGTQEKPVQLLPAEGPNWLGVAIVNAPEQSQFSWVRMEGATGGPMGPHRISGGLAVMGSQVQIEDTILQDFTAPDTLHLHRSTFEIERLTLIGGSGDGIDSDWSYGHISDSHFQKSVGDAIDLSGSLVTIDRVLIEGAEDKGISIGEGSVAYINEAQIMSNRIGVAVKDESLVFLTKSEISDNRYGLLRYIKKPAYTYPSISVTDTIIHGNSIDLREEEPSQWTRRYDG